jgi:TonB family protein
MITERTLGPWVIAGSLLFSFPSVTVFAQQETADQFVERVQKAIEKEEWGRAKSGIRHALALEPKSAAANFVAAQVYWHEGARSMAIASLQKAIESQPIFPEAHFLLARCLKDDNKLEAARGEVDIAINQGSPLYSAYRLIAELEIAKGDFDAAIAALETALRFSDEAGNPGATAIQDEIDKTRAFVERLKRFSLLQVDQRAPDIVRPVQLNSPQPRYTKEARALKLQGSVLMAILVTENGDVDSVLVIRGLGHGMDEQAEEMARNLKFSPATRRGKPIPYWMKVIIEFNLL